MNLRMDHLPMPLTIVLTEPMDDDALLDFCAANDLYRIERTSTGELKIMTPTGWTTGFRNAEITAELVTWARTDGRGMAFDSNTGWSLPDGSMLSPDASWIERSKWESISPDKREKFAPFCPTFVIELRSATDSRKELERKMELWLENGTQVAWLIDPKDRSVTIYRVGDEVETFFDPSTVQGTGPVAGFELTLSWVWGDTSSPPVL